MLPRAARLKRNRDFRSVYHQRRSYATSNLVLYVRNRNRVRPEEKSDFSLCRIGFVISKKIAKRAHDRNRLKRRLREICRLKLLPNMGVDAPVDIVITVRSQAPMAQFTRLAADVEKLARQAGLL